MWRNCVDQHATDGTSDTPFNLSDSSFDWLRAEGQFAVLCPTMCVIYGRNSNAPAVPLAQEKRLQPVGNLTQRITAQPDAVRNRCADSHGAKTVCTWSVSSQ